MNIIYKEAREAKGGPGMKPEKQIFVMRREAKAICNIYKNVDATGF